MASYRLVWALLTVMSAAPLLVACDGGDERPTATPSGTAQVSPVGETSTATATAAAPTPTGTAAAPTKTSVPTTPTATSSPPTPLVVGFDMDPTGNSCPGTGTEDCTLSSIEQCISVPNVAGQTFSVDMFIKGLPRGFVAWNANVDFPDVINSPAKLTLTKTIEDDPLLNLIVQSPESDFLTGSEQTPDPPGSTEPGTPFHAGAGDFGTSEDTPPFTQGVVARYEFTVGTGATNGIYQLSMDPLFVVMLDKDTIRYVVDEVGTGTIALGQDCP